MKKISKWARTHKWSARILIIVLILLLNVIGIYTGLLLKNLGILIPVAALLFFAIAYGIGFILYPQLSAANRKRFTNRHYIRQKSCDFLLAASTFCMFIYLGNHTDRVFQYDGLISSAMATNTIHPKDSSGITWQSISAFSASLKDENGKLLKWKERKQLLKEQVKAIKKSGTKSDGGKALLIILSVLVAMGLIYGILALACSLSCGGSDILAVIVALGGTALIVWLLFVVIRKITGKKGKKKSDSGEG